MADVQSDASSNTPEAPTPAAPPAASVEPVLESASAGVESRAEAAEQALEAVAEPMQEAVEAGPQTLAAEAPATQEVVSAVPELESTTIVPPSTGSEAGPQDGGEWELLLGKVQAWLGEGKLQALWAQARNPISLILAAAALLVVLRVYSALLAAIDSLPLIPGLLELVGVIWAVRFGVPKLVQRSQRQELISALQQRWESFRGRG